MGVQNLLFARLANLIKVDVNSSGTQVSHRPLDDVLDQKHANSISPDGRRRLIGGIFIFLLVFAKHGDYHDDAFFPAALMRKRDARRGHRDPVLLRFPKQGGDDRIERHVPSQDGLVAAVRLDVQHWVMH